MSKIIGIDLGTGNSCVAVVEGGKPSVIVNNEGSRTTPSVVGFSDGSRKVGASAKRQATTNAKNTVSSIKRFMGNTYDEVAKEIDMVSYTVEKGPNNTPRVNIDGKLYTPQEISSIVLQSLKKSAEDYLHETVTDAVITVPAYFSDSQRKATKEAGEIAGFNVRRIINEPTAAALAYGLDKSDQDKRIAVFDAGQGTFDISILELGGGVFEVLSTNGDTHLGGDDIDAAIVDWLVDDFKSIHGVNLKDDPMALQRLKEAAEAAKIALSNSDMTEINLPYICPVNGSPVHLQKDLSRARFEALIDPIVKRCVAPCTKALADAKLTPRDIDEVILVGGTTRIPKVQALVKDIFGKEPNHSVNPDEAVALGAAIQGSVIAGENTDIVLLDVTPLNFNITTMGSVARCMIAANTTIPTSKKEVFTTAVDNQPVVAIEVTQGNRPMARDNKIIGTFNLDGIAPALKGVPQIEVTFDIDSNGILTVTAVDLGTGKSQNIRIEGSSGLSAEEIERMKKDAEANADADKAAVERIKVLNDAESHIYSTPKQIEDLGDKIDDADKAELNDTLESLKAVYNVPDADRDVNAIKAATDSLLGVWNRVMAKVYSKDSSKFGRGM